LLAKAGSDEKLRANVITERAACASFR